MAFVRIACLGGERDVGCQGRIAEKFLPYEIERVVRAPHVFTTGHDRIAARGHIGSCRTRMQYCSNIGLPFEDA